MAMSIFIENCKEMIERDALAGLQEYYQEHHDRPFAWDYVYQKLYLHACLKKKKDIVEWLVSLFPSFNPMQQIAMRQMFPYGRYLLSKA